MEHQRSMESVTKFGALKTSLKATHNDEVIELRGEWTEQQPGMQRFDLDRIIWRRCMPPRG